MECLDATDIKFTETGNAWLQVRRYQRDVKSLLLSGEPKDLELCPVTALAAWLEEAEIVQGPLFRAVQNMLPSATRLNKSSITHVLKFYSTQAGQDYNVLRGKPSRARKANRAVAAAHEAEQAWLDAEARYTALQGQYTALQVQLAKTQAMVCQLEEQLTAPQQVQVCYCQA